LVLYLPLNPFRVWRQDEASPEQRAARQRQRSMPEAAASWPLDRLQAEFDFRSHALLLEFLHIFRTDDAARDGCPPDLHLHRALVVQWALGSIINRPQFLWIPTVDFPLMAEEMWLQSLCGPLLTTAGAVRERAAQYYTDMLAMDLLMEEKRARGAVALAEGDDSEADLDDGYGDITQLEADAAEGLSF